MVTRYVLMVTEHTHETHLLFHTISQCYFSYAVLNSKEGLVKCGFLYRLET